MSFISRILMRLARAILDNVLSQLTQLLNTIQEQALAPIRAMIELVTGGAWIGTGADAFVEEVSNLVIPGVGKVGDQIGQMNTDLQSARDVIDRADEEVDRLIKGRLGEAFGFY